MLVLRKSAIEKKREYSSSSAKNIRMKISESIFYVFPGHRLCPQLFSVADQFLALYTSCAHNENFFFTCEACFCSPSHPYVVEKHMDFGILSVTRKQVMSETHY